jgi:hypothetical protein
MLLLDEDEEEEEEELDMTEMGPTPVRRNEDVVVTNYLTGGRADHVSVF